MSEAQAAILARSLVREYERDRGVCGIDLEVGWGECYALLGRNGSGKSTLTRLLIGMEPPDSGELVVAGASIVPLTPKGRLEHLARLGISLDTSVHWPKLSGAANAWFVACAYRLGAEEIEDRLARLFADASLADHSVGAVKEYSFGMRRKLSVVEALCHEPKILILDEPTSGVDVHFAERLAELIAERCRKGLTTWVASNDPDWVAKVATRVAFVDRGRIIAEGTVGALLAEVAPFQEIKVILEEPVEIPVPDRSDVKAFERVEAAVTVLAAEDPKLIPEIMEWIVEHGGRIASVQVRRSSLRDAFLIRTGKELAQ